MAHTFEIWRAAALKDDTVVTAQSERGYRMKDRSEIHLFHARITFNRDDYHLGSCTFPTSLYHLYPFLLCSSFPLLS